MKTMIRMYLAAVFCLGITTGLAGSNANITNCVPVSGGFKLEWIPGGEAVVKWTPDLMVPFSNLSGTLPAGQGSYTDSVHGEDDQCFYLVELDTPEGMVLIPGGSNSGTNPLAPGEAYDPPYYPETYSLTVTAFYMDTTEVTKAQWDVVYSWTLVHDYSFDYAGSGKAADHPVHTVSWYDCVKWCNARSQMEGRTPCYTVGGSTYKTGQSDPDCNFSASGYRLPTSEEWEYAARGGYSSRRFPWGNSINHNYANYWANGSAYSYDTSPYTTYTFHPAYDSGGDPYTSPVGSFSSSGYGLYDIIGNVQEWCWDGVGSGRRVRGGGWGGVAIYARCGYAEYKYPHYENIDIGFRTVLPAD